MTKKIVSELDKCQMPNENALGTDERNGRNLMR